MPSLRLLDTAVWVAYFRNRAHRDLVEAGLRRNQLLICSVVWMELYAGTPDTESKRELDRILVEAARTRRLSSPDAADFALAGQALGWYSRHFGRVDSRDHLADLLILLCGARGGAEVVTEDVRGMLRWQRVLRRSGLRVEVVAARRA